MLVTHLQHFTFATVGTDRDEFLSVGRIASSSNRLGDYLALKYSKRSDDFFFRVSTILRYSLPSSSTAQYLTNQTIGESEEEGDIMNRLFPRISKRYFFDRGSTGHGKPLIRPALTKYADVHFANGPWEIAKFDFEFIHARDDLTPKQVQEKRSSGVEVVEDRQFRHFIHSAFKLFKRSLLSDKRTARQN